MKLIILFALAIAGGFAQTTNYPGGLDDNRSLFVVQDNVQTTLTAAMTTADTAMVVQSGTGFVPNMIATICDTSTNTGKCTAWEHMLVTAVSGNVLTVTRAFAGTSARSHSSGRLVSVLIDSVHQKVLKDSVIAIETLLGPNGSNLGSSPIVASSTFIFAPQSCNSSASCSVGGSSGMSLIAGNNSVTMNPVPNGVNGSDSNHYLYVSGGTGTAEPCLITGGSGTSGSASGQIIINCSNTHSGAWTIQSATNGIQEAVQSASTSSGVAFISRGTHTLYAHVIVPSNMQLTGSGQGSSVLQVASGAWGAATSSPQWRSLCDSNVSTAVSTVSGATRVRFADFSLNMNGLGQAAGYGMDLALCGSFSTVERVQVYGARHQGAGIASLGAASNDNRILNSVVNGAGLAVGQCTGGIFIQGNRARVADNYIDGMCDDGYIVNGTSVDTSFTGNVYTGNANHNSGVGFHVEDASRALLANNVCNGTVGTVSCFNLSSATNGSTSTDISVIGNLAIGATIGGSFGTSTGNSAKRITVTGNVSLNAGGKGILFSGNVQGLTIQGNTVRNAGSNGIEINSDTLTTASQILISGNYVDHCTQVGLQVGNAGSASPGQEVIITGNVFTDTAPGGSKVQLYGISIFPANGPPTQYIIRNNDLTGNSTAPISVAGGTGNLANSVITDNFGAGMASGAGAPLNSAATLTPTNKMHHVVGTATISTITVPATLYPGDTITLIPDGTWSTNTSGNISVATTAALGKAMIFTWDNNKWAPSY